MGDLDVQVAELRTIVKGLDSRLERLENQFLVEMRAMAANVATIKTWIDQQTGARMNARYTNGLWLSIGILITTVAGVILQRIKL